MLNELPIQCLFGVCLIIDVEWGLHFTTDTLTEFAENPCAKLSRIGCIFYC